MWIVVFLVLAQDIVCENHFKKFYRIIFKALLLQVIQQNKVSILHINLVFSNVQEVSTAILFFQKNKSCAELC